MKLIIIFSMIMIANSIIGQVVSDKKESIQGFSEEQISQKDSTGSHSNKNAGVVFSNFPIHPEDYAIDIRMMMTKVIEKYGYEEWRLVVLTSELHGHLGVYAIIGAKMGLYAREILNAGHDELIIITNAGSKPPISCLNDGLQVSTGATLGHGLISIREVNTAGPVADFTCGGKTIRIALKEIIYKEIEGSIKEAIKVSGGLTAEYWQRIRELALDIWLEYDRNEIFEIEEVKGN